MLCSCGIHLLVLHQYVGRVGRVGRLIMTNIVSFVELNPFSWCYPATCFLVRFT